MGGLLTLGFGEVSSPFSTLSAPVKGDQTHRPELLRGPWPEPHAHSHAHGLEFSPLISLHPHVTSRAELTPPMMARPCPKAGVCQASHPRPRGPKHGLQVQTLVLPQLRRS